MQPTKKPKLITTTGPEPFYGYPRIWFYRSRANQETKFIMSRMNFIPEHLKFEVCEQYERLYKGGKGKKEANIFLDTEARKYKK